MEQSPIDVMLLSYNPVVGWRIAAVSQSKFKAISVFKFGSIKLLRIPMLAKGVPGRFCNPRKLLGV